MEGRTQGREAGEDDWLPSVILSSEGEERMRKQEIRFKGGMEREGDGEGQKVNEGERKLEGRGGNARMQPGVGGEKDEQRGD